MGFGGPAGVSAAVPIDIVLSKAVTSLDLRMCGTTVRNGRSYTGALHPECTWFGALLDASSP